MQSKLFITAALVSALSSVSAQSSTTSSSAAAVMTSLSPSQASKATADLNAYYSTLKSEAAYTSLTSILATGLPQGANVDPALANGTTRVILPVTTMPGYSALPSAQLSYLSSIAAVETSIVNKDASGAAPQPTGGMMAAAGAAIVGVLGAAAML